MKLFSNFFKNFRKTLELASGQAYHIGAGGYKVAKTRNNFIFWRHFSKFQTRGQKMIQQADVDTLRTTQTNRNAVIADLLPDALAISKIYIKTNKWLEAEIKSETQLSLIKAIDAISRGGCKHTEYWKYICSCIYGDIRNLIEREVRRKHSDIEDVPVQARIEAARLDAYNFTEFELLVIDLCMSGCDQTGQISRRLRVRKALVCDAVQSIKEKILGYEERSTALAQARVQLAADCCAFQN